MNRHFCAALTLSALSIGAVSANTVDNMSLPEPIRVPAGHAQSMWTVGKGEITYACKMKPDQSGHAWTFMAPVASLWDDKKMEVGKYYAGPTWEAADGSKVMGKQLAVSPGGDGNIPLQLVQANPQGSMGAMSKVSYIQRLNTQGGVAPKAPCAADNAGAEMKVAYQADYVFYTATQR